MNPTDRTNQTESGYSFGGKAFQYETRLDANNQPYRVDVPVGTAPAFNTAPTVISNETKRNQVTDMTNKINQMVQGRGQVTNGEVTQNADGSVVQDNYQDPVLPPNATPIYGNVNGQANRVIGYNQANLMNGSQSPIYFDSNSSTPAQSPEEKQFTDTLASMKAMTDATTARTIASIEQKFGMLKSQQEQINKGQAAATENALLMGGITGQGSSAQYAPISSIGIVTAQLNYGVQKLAELDAQEQDLVNQAQSAGDAQNFKLMEKQLDRIEKIREEKVAAAKTLNDKIAEQNAKAREKLIQGTRDVALADLYSQGITEPTEILKLLNKNGGDFTLKEITDGIKNIVPPGLDDLVKTLRQNGAPQDVLQKVLSSGNINEAYKNAGTYGAGGAGIIGEYNYYKTQAEAAGLNPVDFSTYQNEDANRKAVAAGGVTAGAPTSYKEWELAGKPGTYEQWLKDSNVKAPTVAQQTVAEYAARLEQAEPTINKLQDTIKNMNFAKFETQVKLPATFQSAEIQQYMQAARNFINAKLRRESGAVISNTEFTEARQQYLPQPGDTAANLALKKANRDLVFASLKKAAGNAFESVEDLLGTSNTLIQGEEQATQKLQQYIQSNPAKEREVSERIEIMEKTLGRPATTMEFLEAYPEYTSFNEVEGDTNLALKVLGGLFGVQKAYAGEEDTLSPYPPRVQKDTSGVLTAPVGIKEPKFSPFARNGIVEGVDITRYATDPKHEQKIASIVGSLGDVATTTEIDNYIKERAPNSPVTGSMITSVAKKYQISPKLILAIIQNDSSFGTKGKGARSKNPGNVGNDDTGKIVNFKSWQEGVEAVAKWLKKHQK